MELSQYIFISKQELNREDMQSDKEWSSSGITWSESYMVYGCSFLWQLDKGNPSPPSSRPGQSYEDDVMIQITDKCLSAIFNEGSIWSISKTVFTKMENEKKMKKRWVNKKQFDAIFTYGKTVFSIAALPLLSY